MPVVGTSHYPEKTINLYGTHEYELWKELEKEIKSRDAAEGANEGEVAAQAFAEVVGADGPLDGGDDD